MRLDYGFRRIFELLQARIAIFLCALLLVPACHSAGPENAALDPAVQSSRPKIRIQGATAMGNLPSSEDMLVRPSSRPEALPSDISANHVSNNAPPDMPAPTHAQIVAEINSVCAQQNVGKRLVWLSE